jgi:ABC-type transporter lipoprotein component MlaA
MTKPLIKKFGWSFIDAEELNRFLVYQRLEKKYTKARARYVKEMAKIKAIKDERQKAADDFFEYRRTVWAERESEGKENGH